MAYLKSQYQKSLIWFVLANVLVFWFIVISPQLDFDHLQEMWKDVTAKDGIILLLCPIVLLLLSGIINGEQAARIVYWRKINPLPGCRVFSELAIKDARIDMQTVAREWGPLGSPRHGAVNLNEHQQLPYLPESLENVVYLPYPRLLLAEVLNR
jgi:hypothetical protein